MIIKVVEELKKHQSNNAEIVFVSGSFMPCLAPIANKLGVKHVLAIQLEEINGKLTGNILLPQTIGEGKAEAMNDFMRQHPGISLKSCYAYGDHESYLAMLLLVGNPIVVGDNVILTKTAFDKNWKILS